MKKAIETISNKSKNKKYQKNKMEKILKRKIFNKTSGNKIFFYNKSIIRHSKNSGNLSVVAHKNHHKYNAYYNKIVVK